MTPRPFPERIKGDAEWQKAMLLNGGDTIVQLTIVVGHDGGVMEVLSVRGPEQLTARAVEEVRQWKFRPTLLNGRPVEVQTEIALFVP